MSQGTAHAVRVLQKKRYHFTWIFLILTQMMTSPSVARLACGNYYGGPSSSYSPLTRLFPVIVNQSCVTTKQVSQNVACRDHGTVVHVSQPVVVNGVDIIATYYFDVKFIQVLLRTVKQLL
ncbi:hypothetical protein BJY52DRAFT_179604 [Lactarius psammicola]|nr:hypothetical protein BJY52DRAFT_179604 [Lactarius psammicola]